MTRSSRIAMYTVAVFAFALPLASIAQTADLQLRGVLNGGNVVSATESPATGEVAAMLTEDGILRVDLVYAGLTENATGGALHIGKESENGQQVQALAIDTDAVQGRLADVEIALTPPDAERVRAGEAYVVITTLTHTAGAIRGQLIPQPIRFGDLQPEGEVEPEEEE